MRVYVDRRVSERQARVILSVLAGEMGIESWDNITPARVSDLAAEYLAEELGKGASERTRLEAIARDLDEPTFRGLIVALRDRVGVTGSTILASWRDGYERLEHKDPELTIERASPGSVSLDGREYDVTSEGGICRLNLRLFIRELDQAVFGGADGEERIAAALRDSAEELQASALSRLASSAPAQRGGGGEEALHTSQQSAVELAVREFLGQPSLL